MNHATFRPGGLVRPDRRGTRSTLEKLRPGEKVIPFSTLERHWTGDRSALLNWADENGVTWPQGGGDVA